MFINKGPLHAKLVQLSVGVSDAYYRTLMLDDALLILHFWHPAFSRGKKY